MWPSPTTETWPVSKPSKEKHVSVHLSIADIFEIIKAKGFSDVDLSRSGSVPYEYLQYLSSKFHYKPATYYYGEGLHIPVSG